MGTKLGSIAIFSISVALAPRIASGQNQTLHVLLSADPGAPSAASIVQGFDFSAGGTPPLEGLAAETPVDAQFLLPKRASGAFADYLEDHPDTPRARLERYIIVRYSADSNLSTARNALLGDADVEHVHIPAPAEFATPAALAVPNAFGSVLAAQTSTSWQAGLGIPEAWQFAGGWALVGVVDSGIATMHPDLVSFSGAKFQGGNWLPALSFDIGRTGADDCETAGNCIEANVDEAQPVAVAVGGACDADGDGLAAPASAGHGTHVAGLVAAQGPVATGACKHCGLAAWRVATDTCSLQTGQIRTPVNAAALDAAVTLLSDLGAQVINLSSTRSIANPAHCQTNPDNSECQALFHAANRGVLVVGAAGNHRTAIGFPASHATVMAAGGVGSNLAIWNRDPDAPPNHLDQCPQPPAVVTLGQECGSNFTVNPGTDRRQEVVAPADAVLSTTYPGMNWNAPLGCGDGIAGTNGDGVGPCTGTSMAAPIVAGIAGLLRSINPLVPPGDPENAVDAVGIRDVVVATTDAAKAGSSWSPQLGYGRPDAAEAARRLLGVVRGAQVRNRAIPLFDFRNEAATDYATTSTPHMAMTLAHAQPWLWAPRGPLVAGYAAFPLALGSPAPRASAFVLSTEFRTRSNQPPIAPLYQLSRSRPWPLGCTPGAVGCNHANRDFLLLSADSAVESAVADGYEFLGRQGFIFQRCNPEPTCVPAGATRLYRLCNIAEDDCAIFLEHELATFQTAGYTTPYPAGADPVMGYAYRNIDTDGDTLIDGFEHLIGTNPASADSDGDGSADGVEYPLAGVPVSDPCAGPVITCTQQGLFFDGFE